MAGVRWLVVLVVATCVFSAAGVAQAATTRPCGTLAIGIGWHVAATRTVTCSSARLLIRTVLHRGCQKRCLVRGYTCTPRYLKIAEHVQCVRGRRVVTGRSFGY